MMRLSVVSALLLSFSSTASGTSNSQAPIFFQDGSAELMPKEQEKLVRETKLWMEQFRFWGRTFCSIAISGHADRSASDERSLELSFQRAQRVRAILKREGLLVAPTHIEGFGELRPLIDTPDGISEPANNRVEIYIRTCPGRS